MRAKPGYIFPGGDVGLLHHWEGEEVLPSGQVQPAVQHEAQLLELNHVAGLVGVLGQTVEPHCLLSSPLSREC